MDLLYSEAMNIAREFEVHPALFEKNVTSVDYGSVQNWLLHVMLEVGSLLARILFGRACKSPNQMAQMGWQRHRASRKDSCRYSGQHVVEDSRSSNVLF
jgi:hypothetical protein